MRIEKSVTMWLMPPRVNRANNRAQNKEENNGED